MKGSICIAALLLAGAMPIMAQSTIVEDFKPVCDTMSVLLQEKTSVKNGLELRTIVKKGATINMYFTKSLSDVPFQKDTYQWFRSTIKEFFPPEYRKCRLGEIYSGRVSLDELVTNRLNNSGEPDEMPYSVKDRRYDVNPLVEDIGHDRYEKGLSGRHIALWQSHGRYYEQKTGRWEWQRACLFQTVEDMFTPGFVLPYLVPMLENAGCNVLLPRERDTQTTEIITDNDPHFIPDISADPSVRTFGIYSETGRWEDAGQGFADTAQVYVSDENPFRAGSARMADCLSSRRKGSKVCTATWTPVIPQRGRYAVYVSYKSLPNSTDAAHYTVRHLGGESHFSVNQQMGGGTWIYLGTFEFEKGGSGKVTLDNVTPDCRKYRSGSVVTADAVKIGGGMGNIARRCTGDSLAVPELSGMPRFAEGARYWMQWAGADTSVYSQNCNADDYLDDLMSRGKWVKDLSGGSRVNRDDCGRNIPIDMAFAFHTDAGVTPGDSTIGTLGIYTLECESGRNFPDKSSRMTSRELTDLVQSQVVNDLRAGYDPLWSRRHIWDRSYSESRTTGVPTMLLELMSHQNFADMKHGLDPSFRFTVSRAVYKGILKYMSNRYGCSYAVQPLPVHSFAARFKETKGRVKAELSWKETPDTLEPTAKAESYILYTRIDDGAFDTGRTLEGLRYSKGRYSTDIDIEAGHIYSFRIVACNSGGRSFPGETLSIGFPEKYVSAMSLKNNPEAALQVLLDSSVVIVNNFDRVSCPAWFDTPMYAGFDNTLDSGVPYINDLTFIGEMFQNRREMPWTDDDNAGFGASFSDKAGKPVAGNTFDYPYTHGKAVLKAGYPFFSVSADAFTSESGFWRQAWSADIICGKQVTTMTGRGAVPDRYSVFPQQMQYAIAAFARKGGNILISGANIGTDIWDRVFPVQKDSAFRQSSAEFAENVLGYKWICNYASRTARVALKPERLSGFRYAIPGNKETNGMTSVSGKREENSFSFANRQNSRIYSVETPDGIAPAQQDAKSFLTYQDTRISAGICYDAGRYRTVCIGFPIETIEQPDALDAIIISSLKFFTL